MTRHLPTSFPRSKFGLRRVVLLTAVVFWALTGFASAQAVRTGEVEGYVANAISGDALTNARVRIVGTSRETTTNTEGVFRFYEVPPGEITIEVSHLGMHTVTGNVTIEPDKLVTRDFTVGIVDTARPSPAGRDEDVVMLERYSVEAQAMSAQSVALAEQRLAANIKNVISLDEFVDMADGNVGEFMKFIPGIDMQYSGYSPSEVSLRGMPSSTTLVQFDGLTPGAAPVENDRSFDFSNTASVNVERIEVSKVPTPDMPANAIGGSVNIISKTGFSRRKPLFTYNVYLSYNGHSDDISPTMRKLAGPDSRSIIRQTQLGYNFSYILPIKRRVAFTFTYSRSPRYVEAEFIQPTWNVTDRVLMNARHMYYINNVDAQAAKATIDWKVGRHGTLQLNYQNTNSETTIRQTPTQIISGSNTSQVTGDQYHVVGDTGTGTAYQDITSVQRYRDVQFLSAKYKHEGRVWTVDAHVSHSWGSTDTLDLDDGLFYTARVMNNVLDVSATGLNGANDKRFPVYTITKRGVPWDPYDAQNYLVDYVESRQLKVSNKVDSVGLNAARQFEVMGIPTRIKTGFFGERMTRESTGGTRRWNIRGKTGPFTGRFNVTDFDLLAEDYSKRIAFKDADGAKVQGMYLSMPKFYDLFLDDLAKQKSDPHYSSIFGETGSSEPNRINGSTYIEEAIAATYLRLENHFFGGRLWVVYGVRYEYTRDNGSGAQNRGKDELPLERGRKRNTHYDGLYPSINSSFTITQNLVLRAAYAKAIGRPDLQYIIPKVNITEKGTSFDPDAPPEDEDDLNGTIELVDGNLQPWHSENFDLTLELYETKGITASVSLFYKDIENFFERKYWTATPQDLEALELPIDQYEGYRIARWANSSVPARIKGIELSYRQNLRFIPVVGKGMNVFGTLTLMDLSGAHRQAFEGFSKRSLTAGFSYVHSRWNFRVSMTHRGEKTYRRLVTGANNPTDSYSIYAPQTRIDASVQYRLGRTFSLYCSVRNLTSEPTKLGIDTVGMDLPDYVKPRNYQHFPAVWTLGVKGSF